MLRSACGVFASVDGDDLSGDLASGRGGNEVHGGGDVVRRAGAAGVGGGDDLDWAQPCSMCSMWVDGFDGVTHHLAPHAGFAVITPGSAALRAGARHRGWRRVRLLSAQGDDSCQRLRTGR